MCTAQFKGVCPKCGRGHNRSKTGPCPRCASQQFYATEKGRRSVIESIKRYDQRNPDVNRRSAVRWRESTGRAVPEDIHFLRAALKRLDAALASAENSEGFCEPSFRRLHQITERRNRPRDGAGVFSGSQGSIPGDLFRVDEVQVFESESKPGY